MEETLMVMGASYLTALILSGGWYLLYFRPAEAARKLQYELRAMQQENNRRWRALESEIARLQGTRRENF